MFKAGDKIKIPLHGTRPCWDSTWFIGKPNGVAKGKVDVVEDRQYRIEYTLETETIKWWISKPEHCENIDSNRDAYPTLSEPRTTTAFFMMTFPYANQVLSTEEIKKATETAASYVRRNFRAWPLGQKIEHEIDYDSSNKPVVSFFFAPEEPV